MTAETLTEPTVITEPGVYDAMPEHVYHGDPVPEGSLSSSGAKRLLPPSCPALFKWERDHGRAEKRAFDFGHAAHNLVLGIGADLAVVDAADWRTKAAQAKKTEAYASGQVPILAAGYQQVKDMAAVLRAHPYAGALFDPERGGRPEQSAFWRDERHEVWRRARFDWLPAPLESGRMILPDYKSTVSAEPGAFAKAVANFSYHQQGDWYSEAVRALGLADVVVFVLVAQEKTPPYLITVGELDAEALRIGRHLNNQALGVFADCTATGTWPGYSTDVELLTLPRWAAYPYQEI